MEELHEKLFNEKVYINPISKVLVYIYTCFTIIGFFISLSPISQKYSNLSDIGLLLSLTASILSFVLLYKIWNCLQDEDVRATGGAAVFYLFIPFYNLYWVFQAYLGWALDFNKVRSKIEATSPKMPVLLGLGMSIAPFIAIISLFLFVFVSIKFTEEYQFYVEREGKSVRIVHQAQIRENEQLYQYIMNRFMPVSNNTVPTEQEYKVKYRKYVAYCSIAVLPLFFCFLIHILFFVKASSCINSLYQKQITRHIVASF